MRGVVRPGPGDGAADREPDPRHRATTCRPGVVDDRVRGLDAGAIGAFYKDEPLWDAIRAVPDGVYRYTIRVMNKGKLVQSDPTVMNY